MHTCICPSKQYFEKLNFINKLLMSFLLSRTNMLMIIVCRWETERSQHLLSRKMWPSIGLDHLLVVHRIIVDTVLQLMNVTIFVRIALTSFATPAWLITTPLVTQSVNVFRSVCLPAGNIKPFTDTFVTVVRNWDVKTVSWWKVNVLIMQIWLKKV